MLVDNLSTSLRSSGEGGGGGLDERTYNAGLMKIITSTCSLPFGVILCSVLTASLGEQWNN